MSFNKFPHTFQLGLKDCGPTCLKIVADYFGHHYSVDFLREKCHITKVGVSMLGISEAAEIIGFRSTAVQLDIEELKESVQVCPAIIHWKHNHFVVLYKCPKKGKTGNFYISDPGAGLIYFNENEFLEYWIGEEREIPVGTLTSVNSANKKPEGYALFLEPTPAFYDEPIKEGLEKKANFARLWFYFKPYKRYFIQLMLGMALGSIIMLISPFLTQSLVDFGINTQNTNFVYLILFAQLTVFVGNSLVDVLRSWILLHIGSRMNITMVSDFFLKLLNLPIAFFEQHVTGDLLQRIHDHKRVENLLTVTSLNSIFSIINILILSVVLASYSSVIFIVFLFGAGFGLLWTWIFLKARRKIDFKFFDLYSKESNKVIEILNGVQDIKISNSGRQKRWEWENIQSRLFKVKIKSLGINQIQDLGASFINQFSSIVITFIAAKSVIDGHLSLGTMFAINLIVGQLNNPLNQLLDMITVVQDAKLGMERINDILQEKDEDSADVQTVNLIPTNEDIIINDVTFNYGSERLDPVLKNIQLQIPAGKITAIVGSSGSGKTTLMKLLLRFYKIEKGNMYLGGINFKNLHHGMWRENCGVVMQDGQIFSGTIADNIALGSNKNFDEIINVAKIACIDEFINSLPMGYMTEVGSEGTNLSTGQKQRILLARALYKNPAYLFLDEATSALDANNELNVMNNLQQFFSGRTVVIVAHRLSTVKNADQLIVLDKGEIVEIGSHLNLAKKKGKYYQLVKNQLELGD